MRSPIQHVIFLPFIFSMCFGKTIAVDSLCGDWEPYKEEKCFKIFESLGFKTYEDAIKTCSQQENSATLVIIRSKVEQDFLSNLLFKTHKVVDNVWIGVKYNTDKFKWIDDSELSFTNWVEGSPKNKTEDGCVQMQLEDSSVGKWIDEPCNKKNLVVCQKMQTWSLSRLQINLLDARKKLEDSLEDTKKQLKNHESTINNQQSKLDNIQKNPVPIGFIYAQLPGELEPKNLWPTVEWEDISSKYAGLFFRVQGGGSAGFEEIQEENSPRLTDIKFIFDTSTDLQNGGILNLTPGKWSRVIYTGGNAGSNCFLSFLSSSGEVRPRNKAMRIWKRSK